MKENYYHILGLDNFSKKEEIKKAYRQLAKKYHPDKASGSEEKFKRISTAYQKLIDPTSKEVFDANLRKPNTTNYGTFYQQPKYTRRTSYYTTEKKEYSRKVKIYGAAFTIVFLVVAICIPLWLSYKASNYHYQEGLMSLKNKDYYQAVISFNTAISWIGQRSGEASIAAARLYLEKVENLSQAQAFINKGFEYASEPKLVGELYFLAAKLHKQQNSIEKAKEMLLKAGELQYHKDSISMQLGLIKAFYSEQFEEGITYFEEVIASNSTMEEAIFGKAWCLQRLNRPQESILVYNQLIDTNPNHMLGNFYRGHNFIVLGDTTAACKDFLKALQLGYQPAAVYLEKQCKDELFAF